MNISIPSKKDWGKDFSHENGNYECRCCSCGHSFIGHKRRVVCFECANTEYKNFDAMRVQNAQ